MTEDLPVQTMATKVTVLHPTEDGKRTIEGGGRQFTAVRDPVYGFWTLAGNPPKGLTGRYTNISALATSLQNHLDSQTPQPKKK